MAIVHCVVFFSYILFFIGVKNVDSIWAILVICVRFLVILICIWKTLLSVLSHITSLSVFTVFYRIVRYWNGNGWISLHTVIAFTLDVNLLWGECQTTALIRNRHWFKWWLGTAWQQAITRTNVDSISPYGVTRPRTNHTVCLNYPGDSEIQINACHISRMLCIF